MQIADGAPSSDLRPEGHQKASLNRSRRRRRQMQEMMRMSRQCSKFRKAIFSFPRLDSSSKKLKKEGTDFGRHDREDQIRLT